MRQLLLGMIVPKKIGSSIQTQTLDPVDPESGCDLDPVSHWLSGSRVWVLF